MLRQRMMRKLSEQERESLFLKWGIGLNTKLRRLQLANRLWTKTDDMDHISDSAFLVAKLVGSVEPGKIHDKEMFGLNFTPRCAMRTYSLKRSLISLLWCSWMISEIEPSFCSVINLSSLTWLCVWIDCFLNISSHIRVVRFYRARSDRSICVKLVYCVPSCLVYRRQRAWSNT